MTNAGQTPFFFIHVMKTGGSTFRLHVLANFEPTEVYPHKSVDPDMFPAYRDLAAVLDLPAERRERIRVFTGHFPYVVTEMMGVDLVTFTILREPVARTISYLKHLKRERDTHQDISLDEIYDDPFFFPKLIHNHQTKVFSMTREDHPKNILDDIVIDESRLEIAKRNLEKVDLLGLHEHYDEFIAEMNARFGWEFERQPSLRVSKESWEVSDELRARIIRDNAIDIELYEFARELYAKRPRVAAPANGHGTAVDDKSGSRRLRRALRRAVAPLRSATPEQAR